MAEIVGGFLMPHVPTIPNGGFMSPEKTPVAYEAFERIAQRLKELEVDTVIIVGDDHYENFGPHCIPNCLIAIGDVGLSAHAKTLGMDEPSLPNNAPLARHILDQGQAEGIDWAFAKSLDVDHSVGVPYHMTIKMHPEMKIIPVYLNCVVAPFIGNRRAYEVGQSIQRAVQSWSGNERVAVFGTGGISHWVGGPGMGVVNEEFDHQVLKWAEQGDVESLIALDDNQVLEQAGNGALELKNWICAMGAVPNAKTETITYIAIHEWVTGCGFAEIKAVA